MMIILFRSGVSSSNLHISHFLALRRVAYGSKAHFLNILLYLMGLMPLTYLIVSLRPSMSTNGTGDHNITMVKVSFQEVLKKPFVTLGARVTSNRCNTHPKSAQQAANNGVLFNFFFFFQQSLVLSFCMIMVVVMNIYAIIKELVQMSQQVGSHDSLCDVIRDAGWTICVHASVFMFRSV